MGEVRETQSTREPSKDALQWELEVHMAEYERAWRHGDLWNESRRTLVRYIVAGTAVGFGALVAAYDPSDARTLELLSNVLLVVPLLFAFATLSYLGHYRVVVVSGDYIRFRLTPRIREIIRALDEPGRARPDIVLRFEEVTGRRPRTFARLMLRGAIGLGDLGILMLPSVASLSGYVYVAGWPPLAWCSLQGSLFWFDSILTILMAILVLAIGYVGLTREEPMDF